MRGTRILIGLLAASATLSTATACARTNQAAGDLAPEASIGLVVTNQNFWDMDVYAVSEGLSTRIGTVTGNTSRRFILNPSVASRDLRIVGSPIGGSGQASSGNVTVLPGQTLTFTIAPNLRNSTVTIR